MGEVCDRSRYSPAETARRDLCNLAGTMSFALIVSLVALALLAEIMWTHMQLRRAIRRVRPPRRTLPLYPSVTVIRPMRGRDVGADENVAAALDTGYPGEVETIFVLDDERDPAYPMVCAAVD